MEVDQTMVALIGKNIDVDKREQWFGEKRDGWEWCKKRQNASGNANRMVAEVIDVDVRILVGRDCKKAKFVMSWQNLTKVRPAITWGELIDNVW